MKYVSVVFNEGNNDKPAQYQKRYCYFTDLDLDDDDKVVVRVGGEGGKMHVVTVVDTAPSADERTRAHEWIVQKVDTTEYETRVEKAKRKQELFDKLDAIKAEADRMAKYETLAAGGNKEAKALVKELKAL